PAFRPQPDLVGLHPREAERLAVDAAVLVAGDAPGEGHVAIDPEDRGVVVAGAAGDEAAAEVVLGPVRASLVVQSRCGHLETGAIGARLDLDDPPAPADDLAGGLHHGRVEGRE